MMQGFERGQQDARNQAYQDQLRQRQLADDDLARRNNNYTLLQKQLQYKDEQMGMLHAAATNTAAAFGAQVQSGAADPDTLTKIYNEGAPDGQGIRSGTLQVKINRQTPDASVLQYTRQDGTPMSVNLGSLRQYVSSFTPAARPDLMPVSPGATVIDKRTGKPVYRAPQPTPTDKRITVSPGATVVDQSGRVIYSAPPKDGTVGGIGTTSPVSWANATSRQVAENNGTAITFDANGNLVLPKPNATQRAGAIAALASAYGKNRNFAIPPQVAAEAAQYAYDQYANIPGSNGAVDISDPALMQKVDARVRAIMGGGAQPQGYGIRIPPPGGVSYGVGVPPTQSSAVNPTLSSQTGTYLQQARAAVRNGKDPQAVVQRLKTLGVPDAAIQQFNPYAPDGSPQGP